ncbi:hypothetical protein PVK06_009007 [Gossypium arboreum]|uniref:MULE transposase domain-containing protein n=1 Tax=Gossypium arboreum TaxID=29729 RepID=A0ABR0QMR1_GOSAR|nr:hypothetical protein PVK06_009007 [Gossypium arboreum]
MLIYFHKLGTVGLQNNLRVIYDDTSTIAMLDFWVKFKEIELYVQHEVDNPIIIDEIFLLTTGEGDVEGVEVDGEGHNKGVESNGEDGVDNVADECAGDFVTSDGLDNIAVTRSGEEEDRNKAEEVHHCSVSFKNKMVTAAMIAQYFEATIKDHPKMKLREIQRRCASKMLVNVIIDCCYRAKKIVKEKMAGIHNEEFSLLWDYAHELRSNMPGSTIKMVVQRVTANSLPHFKRYYVRFDALKRGWKVGYRPLIGLDGCSLKGPFKSEFLTAVGRDANNQMFFIAWVVVEVECIDSWGWFLSLLSIDLGLENRYGYTIINDQQKIVKCTIEREWKDLWSALETKDNDAYDNLMKKSPKM